LLRVAGALYGVGVLAVAVVLGFFVGTFGVVPFAVVPRGKRERYTMPSAVLFARIVVAGLLGVRARVEGAPDLAEGEGAVVVCNHRSWLDPLLLLWKAKAIGLSKAEIFWIPFIGLYGWLAGAVFFDRRSAGDRVRARREVMTLVRGGHRVQVFPEGTRSRDGRIGSRVYLTLPMDCHEAGLPVVCCAVYGTERVLPPNEPAAWPFQEVRLRFGRTMRPKDFPDSRTFADACWAEVVALATALESEERTDKPDVSEENHALNAVR
jgi:1-acyl-sn-glycerol-3-phosphate acyltransferase